MIRFLAENIDYKVYSIYESVYLKTKKSSKNLDNFEESDTLIGVHYGEPNNAIILNSNNHIVVSGCGLSIYEISTKDEKHILSEPDNITWTNVVYQDELDNLQLEFRFVSFNKVNDLRVFKMNLKTQKIIEL